MTQLILDGHHLPESIKGGYDAYMEDLGETVEMISGRMAKEIRGKVWHASYQYGYFDDDMKTKVINACEKGRVQPIPCAILVQEDNSMYSSEFFVTSFTRPKFRWSKEGTPIWADFRLELREVTPHD